MDEHNGKQLDGINRCDFLKAAGVGAAALAIPGLARNTGDLLYD